MIEPSYSPWGSVDHCRMLCYGAFEVQTARHGGVMILCQLADEYLSKEAQDNICALRKIAILRLRSVNSWTRG